MEFILELLASGASNEEILTSYPQVAKEGLVAALEYAARSLRNDVVWDLKVSA